MLEHGWLDRRVLGVAWDGTGYGSDGTIWGGEFLVATVDDWARVASLRPFRLPGGEAAVREPWRIVSGMLDQLGRPETLAAILGVAIPEATRTSVLAVGRQERFSPTTTSAGRLFDAAAVIALGQLASDYEGQLAMQLEAAANPAAAGSYDLPLREGTRLELDWEPLLTAMFRDRLDGTPPGTMAMRFHRALAQGICGVSRRWPDLPVVLSGGVFQNKLLTELVLAHGAGGESRWGPPGRIPPGDGGLAAGQLAILSRWKSAGNHASTSPHALHDVPCRTRKSR
jgi:hydrogenase maturation protein HypF